MKRLWLALLCCLLTAPVLAKEAAPLAQDEQVEKRMNSIAEELRCLVCQNESLAASRADLAVDLRRQIREQIVAGRSDREVMDYMVDRYGDFVRYRPPLKSTTVLLWFGPLLLFVGGLVALVRFLRRRAERVDDAPLDETERARAEALLQQTHSNDNRS